MKIICAWCKRHLHGDPGARQITHSICLDCFRQASIETPGISRLTAIAKAPLEDVKIDDGKAFDDCPRHIKEILTES
jgi:LSD1 subclass zinc finger protein